MEPIAPCQSYAARPAGRALYENGPHAFKVYFIRDRKNVWETRAQIGKQVRETPAFRADVRLLQGRLPVLDAQLSRRRKIISYRRSNHKFTFLFKDQSCNLQNNFSWSCPRKRASRRNCISWIPGRASYRQLARNDD